MNNENGRLLDECSAIEFTLNSGEHAVSYEYFCVDNGCSFKDDGKSITLGEKVFAYEGKREYVGNFLWNAYYFTAENNKVFLDFVDKNKDWIKTDWIENYAEELKNEVEG